MIRNIYKAITNKGYVECLTEAEALAISDNVETIQRDIPTPEEAQEQALLDQKQALLDSIEPLQQKVLQKWDGLASKCKRHEDCKKNNVTIKKPLNEDKYKKALAWGIEVEAQNDDITIDNTLEEIQARVDRINELDELFPEIE